MLPSPAATTKSGGRSPCGFSATRLSQRPAGGASVEPGGQRARRRRLEDRRQRQPRAEALQLGEERDGEQRVAAEGEEVVFDPDRAHAEHLFEAGDDPPLHRVVGGRRRDRSGQVLRAGEGRRSRSSLPFGGQRQLPAPGSRPPAPSRSGPGARRACAMPARRVRPRGARRRSRRRAQGRPARARTGRPPRRRAPDGLAARSRPRPARSARRGSSPGGRPARGTRAPRRAPAGAVAGQVEPAAGPPRVRPKRVAVSSGSPR